MRIDTSDPKVTVLLHRPIFIPGFGLLFVLVGFFNLVENLRAGSWSGDDLFGVSIAILMGGGLFLYTARRDDYRFDARAKRISWTHRNLFGSKSNSIPMREAEGVVVECGPESDSTTYRVALLTKSHGRLPLTQDYTCNEAHHREIARVIEAVLADSTASQAV